MFKIEKNIQMPAKRHKSTTYPFSEMEIGDSFFVKEGEINNPHKLYTANSYYGSRNNKKFTVRKTTENGYIGWRCWRIK